MRSILRLVALLFSAAAACASFILCNYSDKPTFFAGCGFGLAAILIFSIAVNSGGKNKIINTEKK
ncbi:MAG: hypothetical protein ABSA34_03995 [Candidatus Goldiibacteriota bacterium]